MQPLMFRWTGEELVPVNSRWQSLADRHLVVGEEYYLAEHNDRSLNSHRHYFASVAEAWRNLPEHFSGLPFAESAEHLRAYALIRTGYCDAHTIVCSSKTGELLTFESRRETDLGHAALRSRARSGQIHQTGKAPSSSADPGARRARSGGASMSYDDFHSGRTIKATRKPHACEQCGRNIETGTSAYYAAGKYDGHFYTQHEHVECRAAGIDYAETTGLWGEEFTWFQHADHEMRADFGPWLFEHHPLVAERLNIEPDEVEA